MLFSDLESNVCRFDILQKDYTSYDPIELKGTESPVLIEYEAGDTDVLKPIRGASALVRYICEQDDLIGELELYGDEITFIGGLIFTIIGDSSSDGDIVIELTENFATVYTYTIPVVAGQYISSILDAIKATINNAGVFIVTDWVTPGYLNIVSATLQTITDYDFTFPPAGSAMVPKTPLEDFFTENDNEFLGEFYINDVLKFTGYLVQDDCSESFNAPPYPVELKFNDNLGLLSELSLSSTILNLGVASKESIASFFYAILQLTGLDLPLEIYNNVFEENMDDRTYDNTNDAFVQSFLKTASFKEENSYKDCFTVLEQLLNACDCVLFQADGAWVIMRWPELPRFSNNPPGSVLELDVLTESVIWIAIGIGDGGAFQFSGNSQAYRFTAGQSFMVTNATDSRLNGTYTVWYIVTDGGTGSDLVVNVFEQPTEPDFSETVTATFSSTQAGFTASVASDITAINIAAGSDLVPIEFTQIKSLRRGYRYVSRTFDIAEPILIQNQDLLELGTFISETIDGDITNRDYELIGWNEQEGQSAFLRVQYDTISNRGIDRFIVMEYNATESVNDMPSPAIITPKIEVGGADRFRFSCAYRADNNDNTDDEYFGVFFYMRECAGSGLKRLELIQPGDVTTGYPKWNNNFPFSPYDPGVPPSNQPAWRSGGQDKTAWNTYDSTVQYDPNNFGMPAFPYNGTIEVGIYGLNKWRAQNNGTNDAYIKDIKLEYFTSISSKSALAGQIHTATGNPDIKNVLSENIYIDDARQNVPGAIYLDQAEICSVLSDNWKTSSDNTNLYRFGQVQTVDRLGMNQKTRLRIEGDFYMNVIPSMKDIITFGYGGLSASTFIMSRSAYDFRSNRLTATFDEAWNTADADATDLADFDYEFKFKFKDGN